MTASYVFIETTGVISTDTATLLNDVESEWILALGVGLDTDPSTPQGTLIETETLARTSVMKNNAEMGSVINPNYSYGVFLDAIAAFLGLGRDKNIQTVSRGVYLNGDNGTVIPAGSQVETANNDIFILLNDVTIASGAGRGTFYSQKYGPIEMPENATLSIVNGYNIVGWAGASSDAVTDTTLGTVALSDAALKAARLRQLAIQGIGSLASINARALSVDGVTSILAIENATGAIGNVNGINFTTPNGVWICVAGIYDKQQLVDALWLAHMGGQPYDYGGAGQGVQVDPPFGSQVIDPYSQLGYYVKYTTPVMYDLYVNISVKQSKAIASEEDIRQIILSYANGTLNGEQGFVVGFPQSAFEIGGAVVGAFPGLYVKDCKIAAVVAGSAAPVYPGGYSSEWIPSPWQQPQIVRSMINVQMVN